MLGETDIKATQDLQFDEQLGLLELTSFDAEFISRIVGQQMAWIMTEQRAHCVVSMLRKDLYQFSFQT